VKGDFLGKVFVSMVGDVIVRAAAVQEPRRRTRRGLDVEDIARMFGRGAEFPMVL